MVRLNAFCAVFSYCAPYSVCESFYYIYPGLINNPPAWLYLYSEDKDLTVVLVFLLHSPTPPKKKFKNQKLELIFFMTLPENGGISY